MVQAKTWQEMTKEERDSERAKQFEGALLKIQGDNLPTSIRVKIGDHTLKATPVRETGSGGVSYSIAPVFIQVGQYKLRVNKVSLSIVGEGTPVSPDFEDTNSL